MVKRIGAIVFALMGACAIASAQVKINCNVKTGETVSGELSLRVTVSSPNPVTSVEFYVGDQLRVNDDSTPYECRIDTLAEAEGDLTVRIQAYTNKGENATEILKLKIDNQLDKGADFHVEKGNEFMVHGKFQEALTEGRIALKAKANYLPAKMLLARSNFYLGIFDVAQQFVESVLAAEPANLDALDLNAAISLERAFNHATGDRTAIITTIGTALKKAAASRSTVYDFRLDNYGTITDENRLAYCDLALRAGRYSTIISQLSSRFTADPKKTALANRYIYALMRASKMQDATNALTVLFRRGAPDAVSYALEAIVFQLQGKDQESLEAEKQALVNDASDLTVRSAQVYLSLMRGKIQVMGQLLNDLNRDEGNRYEVKTYLSIYNQARGEFELGRNFFEEAVIDEPASHDTYVNRAYQLFALSYNSGTSKDDADFQRKMARTFVDAALAARPNSFQALAATALLDYADNKMDDGVKMAEAATKAGAGYSPGYYLLSIGYAAQSSAYNSASDDASAKAAQARANRQFEEATKQEQLSRTYAERARNLDKARESCLKVCETLDPMNLTAVSTPSMQDAFRYMSNRARLPLLIPVQY